MGTTSSFSFPLLIGTPISRSSKPRLVVAAAASSEGGATSSSATKLLTFLGKGGSGKTTAAILAAQHYAMAGLNTCLVIHGQDTTADYLLNCKIGTSHVTCGKNLSAVRLETTKMLLEPLKLLKQADAQLNMTQGTLGGIVGEELGILPGMDSIFLVLALERLVGFLRIAASKSQQDKFDLIIYDGISSEETLRIIGASSKARLYLKYLRTLAEKTELGRLAAPSLLRLVDEAMLISSSRSYFNGKMSSEIWDTLDQMLERGSSAFSNPKKFGCFLVMDPNNPTSINSALRYWGCTIQTGARVSGAFGITSQLENLESLERAKKEFSPLPSASISRLSMNNSIDWSRVLLDTGNEDARHLLNSLSSQGGDMPSPVRFDKKGKLVTLFMPGFDKSEIKLYQYRGGSELLVEAGDQRRVIPLPPEIQGKVGGAKFGDRSLVITLL
ncbi:hypothetical protein AAZX31_02G095500 [Glycine max]|uniref:Anion-transporting ATPase-like domain-containing protein n=1 Tax=Glycine max TaxID=3847 RepID=K7K7G9_SOYBN|nr:uncharacterized protein At1g26090, chloroplastic [Glycine max]KAG5062680.1 hypothetical protein JHK85_003863 [Glycine max]KAH1059642.1 hypothetical protein GYH30_003580 [Glycine max]KAH1260940.1 chloroplastic protein [Glycine max]KRH70623.1 hypothetical protein GLYMA_02G101000v4 [Glycine max]|eukprot:XP_003518689.1 uncharacterized protein At1g26090, chloroplastic [Glycine max]